MSIISRDVDLHKIFEEIPERILENAKCALTQANMHAVFLDPGSEHWGNMSVLNAAHAGELVMKATIATAHPLLIFQNIFEFDDTQSDEISLERLLIKAKTHDFQHLPKIMWAVLKERIPDPDSFEKIRRMRNAVQHFYHPDGLDNYGNIARNLSLEFIYKNIDPLLSKYFGICAIEFHEDHNVGYDYVVQCLVRRGLKFSVPNDFKVGEIDIEEAMVGCDAEYIQWVNQNLIRPFEGK